MVNWLDMERLGSIRLSSSAVTTGVLTIPAREQLFLLCNIAGYSGGGDIASLRFNGDTGTNYWDRHITSVSGATPPVFVNVQTASTTLLRLAGNAVTTGRSVSVSIMNLATVSKAVGISHIQTASGSAATVGGLDIGGGEWVNTSAQITSIEMRTAGGSVTMPAGTGFTVFGCNP
jgi:hypothetical protein